MHVDTIIDNAQIITGDPTRPEASSVGLWNGMIIGVDEQLDTLRGNTAHRIDAGGATITAGFNDIHAHSVWFGQTLMDIDLSTSTQPAEVYSLLRDHLRTSPDTEWIVASNFQALQLTGSLDIAVLDSITEGRPLVIKHNSGHALTVNSEALLRAGITLDQPQQPEGGEIGVDDAGHVTGLLDENAMRPVQQLVQPDADQTIVQALDLATSHYVSEGLTSITDAGIVGGWIGHSPREFGAYQRARDAGLLSTRMQTMITIDALHTVPGSIEDPIINSLDGGLRSGLGDDRLQIGPTKIFTDGSLIGSTAAMNEDYHHCTHHRGYFQDDPEAIERAALHAAAGGWSLAMHAIGDAAVDFAISVISRATTQCGTPTIPHRIEHGGVVRTSQLTDMARLGAVLVPQPRFITEFGDAMAEKLGPERTLLSYPAKRILDAGMSLPGSSDRPVADGAPLKVMQSFVERLTEGGAEYGADDRISATQALMAYTVGSAHCTGWGGKKGQIIRGQLADLAILDGNPTTVPAQSIGSIGVMATIVGGALEFGNAQWTTGVQK